MVIAPMFGKRGDVETSTSIDCIPSTAREGVAPMELEVPG